MSVIIMHPKHGLKMKYKRWGGNSGSFFLSLGSCRKSECEIPDHDVMKMSFLLENFTLAII